MSYQNEESMLDNIDGVGTGTLLLIGGLILYLADIAPILGLPMIALSLFVPLIMTYSAKQESERQNARRRPEHNRGDGYTISSKRLKRGRS